MRGAIRWLGSLDVDDLDNWTPQTEEWALGIRILAGPSDGSGEDSFDLTVCSLAWLAEQVRREGVVDGRHHLVVDRFSWPSLRTYIERYAERCEGENWQSIAENIARLGYWEFEDYRP